MVPLSAFYSRLMPHVPGCSEPLANQALVDSAIAFCDQALVVQHNLVLSPALPGVSDYEIDMPSQQELSQVLRVWLDGVLLGPVPTSQVGEIESTPGRPRYYFSRTIDEVFNLQVFPTPDARYDPLAVRVATRPTRNATQLSNALMREWADIVVDGALMRLHDTPGQMFTNEAKAVVLSQKVRARINVARTEALRGRVVSSMSVVQRPFV